MVAGRTSIRTALSWLAVSFPAALTAGVIAGVIAGVFADAVGPAVCREDLSSGIGDCPTDCRAQLKTIAGKVLTTCQP